MSYFLKNRSSLKCLLTGLVLVSVLAGTSVSKASTFVGNGGNVGDVELQTTLQQLTKTLTAISDNEGGMQDHLCICIPAYEGRPLCDGLKTLNEAQVRFCSRYIQMKAPELAALTKDKERLRVTWTHEPMEVKEQGKLRAVDAVTNIKDLSLTVNQTSFLRMSPDERTFLFGHELYHLTTYQGLALTDEGSIGPFVGADGSRQFINAMASSLVMMAHQSGAYRETENALLRSQAWQKNWVTLGYSAMSPKFNEGNAFAVDRVDGGELGFRYQLSPELGLLVEGKNLKGVRSRMTQIQGEETRQILSAGASYRWFPSGNPLTFTGQSHAVFAVTLDRVNVHYNLRSARTGLTETADAVGFTVSAKYFIPFRHGFWGYAGLAQAEHEFKLSELEASYTGGLTTTLGVSYGF